MTEVCIRYSTPGAITFQKYTDVTQFNTDEKGNTTKEMQAMCTKYILRGRYNFHQKH